MSRRFLIVRTDRMGDVLLTTPLGSAIRAHFPGCRIGWLVRPYTAPLLERNPDVDDILLDKDQSAGELADSIRRFQPDVALIVYPRWRTVWAAYRAGVPMRIGPANKWYAFLLTHRVWQKRSESVRHEADYNLDLLAPLGVTAPKRLPTALHLAPNEIVQAKQTLEGYRIDLSRPTVILHPGSGGSAARWPLTSFMGLGDRLADDGVQVVVTAGAGETYQNVMLDQMHRLPVVLPAGSLSVRELAAVFAQADLLVSNSTGPLHMAVAVGTPTVSIYSPIRACHPRRWGPYPDFVEGNRKHPVLLAPEVSEGQADMSAVSVEAVLERCRQQLLERKARSGSPQ